MSSSGTTDVDMADLQALATRLASAWGGEGATADQVLNCLTSRCAQVMNKARAAKGPCPVNKHRVASRAACKDTLLAISAESAPVCANVCEQTMLKLKKQERGSFIQTDDDEDGTRAPGRASLKRTAAFDSQFRADFSDADMLSRCEEDCRIKRAERDDRYKECCADALQRSLLECLEGKCEARIKKCLRTTCKLDIA